MSIASQLRQQSRQMASTPNVRQTTNGQPAKAATLPNGNLVVATNGQGRMKLFLSDGRYDAEESGDLIAQVVDGRWFSLPAATVDLVLESSGFQRPPASVDAFPLVMNHLRTLFARKGIVASKWRDITNARAARLEAADASVNEIA